MPEAVSIPLATHVQATTSNGKSQKMSVNVPFRLLPSKLFLCPMYKMHIHETHVKN